MSVLQHTLKERKESCKIQPLWWHSSTLWGTLYHWSYPHILLQKQWTPLTCKLDSRTLPTAKGCAECHRNKSSEAVQRSHYEQCPALYLDPATVFLEPLFLSIGADHPEISAPLHLPMVTQPGPFGSHIWTARDPQVLPSFCAIHNIDYKVQMLHSA